MLRELVTRPIGAVIALIELPVTMQRSLRQANDLMEASRRQLEAMQRQTEDALQQAERMNDLLGRVVKLTEPLEIAQRGSEYVGGRLKRALFGEGVQPAEPAPEAPDPVAAEHASSAEYAGGDDREPPGTTVEGAAERLERAVEDAEAAAGDAEIAATEAESAAEHVEEEAETVTERAEQEPGKPAEPGESPAGKPGGWLPAGSRRRSDRDGLEVPDSATIRVIPNQPPPGEREQER